MASPKTLYMRNEVAPRLDAVRAGFFARFEPESTEAGDYVITCHACGAHSAHYRPHTYDIKCDHCLRKTNIWNAVAATGVPSVDVPRVLSEAIQLPMPDFSSLANTLKAPTTAQTAPALLTAVAGVLREALQKSNIAQDYLHDTRGWSLDEIRRAPVGYYPSARIIADRLVQAGVSDAEAERSGLINADHEQQIVGWWQQPDRTVRLWRHGFGHTAHRGFRLAEGTSLRIPAYLEEACSIRGNRPVVVVSEVLDAARLLANAIPAIAIDAGSITQEQAPVLAAREEPYVIWAATDGAGQGGAERSILRLAPFGKEIGVFLAPKAWPMPEAALDAVGAEQIREGMKTTLGGGAFLARRLASQANRGEREKVFAKGRQWRRILLGSLRDQYADELQRQGLDVGDDLVAALRVAAEAIDTGTPIDEALDRVHKKYDIRINIEVGNAKFTEEGE
jgi:hypothetical protein